MAHAGIDHTRGIDAVLVPFEKSYDFILDDSGDIKSADAFDTSILVSLFTDRRAEPSEVVEASLRRGWIGNESTPDFEIGSKLWLFYQNRNTLDTMNGIVDAAQEALQWMVQDSIPASGTTIANAVSASATLVPGSSEIRLTIEIERPSSRVEKRYFDLWDATGQ
jgi:phage gp46-like protein